MLIRGPANPINIPCPYCGAKIGEECTAKVRRYYQCPEREKANAERLSKLAKQMFGSPAPTAPPGA